MPEAGARNWKTVKERLGEALVEKCLLKPEDLERALALQRERGGSLSQILTEQGLVEPKELIAVLSNTLQIPSIRLSKMEMDPELTKRISRKLAFHYQIVPVSFLGDQLTVAMVDPMNVLALDHLSQTTGMVLVPFLATKEEIQEALNRLYGIVMSESFKELTEEGGSLSTLELVSETKTAEPEQLEDLIRMTQEGPIVRLTNSILAEGVSMKASDILVEPFEKRLRIRYRVDGVFREGKSLPTLMQGGIVSRIKVMSTLNIAEHRLPQDGRIKFFVRGRDVDFRVSVIPSYFGEKVCLRILDKNQATLDLERLGFDPVPLNALKEAATHPHGMILITGPTGSGKTTTLYSLLKLVDTPKRNLVTVEDPVEYDLAGINQVSIHPEIGLTFAAALRSILRQDPNIIMVGEIRDEETADIAIKAALTGHLVLSTLHTNEALGAVARLMNMGIEPYLIASSLLLVGAQRLPRRVCPHCRQIFHPSKQLMERLILPPNGNYCKGKGCPECRGTGLDGRIGLLEAIPLTAQLRRLVAEGASSVKLQEAARAAGFLFLRENAIGKAAEGILPLEEVVRTTVGVLE
ncbi:MAG: Flp pilus assembly complex ATPase component TadA [Candidatus Omnitrophica bacterium]|nr:Flp pilus assembly complex ATPase component TadA [Candidatus Omnitrophota bacterium]